MFKPLEESEVKFTVSIEQDDIPLRGNVMCSGDPQEDEEAERWVHSQLESGNIAAWCVLSVTAEWEGVSATDILCGISCETEADVRDFFLPDSRYNALYYLNQKFKALYNAIHGRKG